MNISSILRGYLPYRWSHGHWSYLRRGGTLPKDLHIRNKLMFLIRILSSVWSKWLAVSLITLLLVGISGSGSTAFADPSDPEGTVEQPPVLPPDKPEHPSLDSRLNMIVEQIGSPGALSIAESSPISVGNLVAITIRVSHNVTDTVEFLESVGAIVANIGADYIETYMPVTALVPLSERDGVLKVSTILPPQSTVTSQGTTVHRSPIWNTRGYTGTGIKVGVIDSGFNGYSALMGSELPSTVIARCYLLVGWFLDNLSFCGSSVHGTAVAEAIADIAPDVTLYIANPLSKGDLQSTAAWMVSEGVQVINTSLEWPWDGPGDGTSYHSESPLNTLDTAVDGGVIWVSAAGNEAESSWHGAYLDSDSDGNLEFVSGDETNHVYLSAGENITIYLRWDEDWGTADSDLDLSIWDYSSYSGWTKLDESNDAQNGTLGQEPIEVLSFTAPWSDTFHLVVRHESGAAPGWFQLVVWGADVEIPISDRSVANPAESSNTGMLAVGAANWATPSTIESFSSHGPTTDGRIKPDIVGADRGDSVSYGVNGFSGTSQASPHIAGLAALVLQRYPEYTPEQVATYLKNNALGIDTVPNNTWGHGLAQMPLFEPTAPIDVTATSGVGQATVAWSVPLDDGGSTVTRYTVISDPDELNVAATGFDAGLTVTDDFGSGDNKGYAMAVSDNGNLLVGGYTYNGTDNDFALARYDSDGTLDTTFGSSGKTTTDFGYGSDLIRAITELDSGEILAAGYSDNGTDYDFALARYSSKGNLDTTFGSGGKTTTDFGYGSDVAYTLTILDSGKILVAGYAYNGNTYDFALARYDSDGTLDTTFGSSGKTTTDFGYGTDVAYALTVLDSGGILAGGYSDNGADSDFALARYDSDGTLDTTFGISGKTTTDFGYGTDVIFDLTVLANGKLLVGGSAHNGTDDDFALARYDLDGTLDNTFGASGKTTTGFGYGSDVILDLTALPDGKIVVVGYAYSSMNEDFALARYHADGSLDISFGSGGKTTTDFSDSTDKGFEVAVRVDGKLVVAGYAYNGSDYDFALARYNQDGGLDPGLTSVVTDLTDGTAYTFTVTATNSIGTSARSDASNSVTTPTVPGAPTEVSAMPEDVLAVVSWTAPVSDGGLPITAYTVTSAPGGVTATTTGTSVAVTGLTNGTAYTFTVTATNAVGSSASSALSSAVTPTGVPDAPTNLSATPSDRQAIVSWTSPASDGGLPISAYTVTSAPGGSTATTTGTSVTVTGLTNGTAYTFIVTATNSFGTSMASDPSTPMTPAIVPDTPTDVTATPSDISAVVSWTAPASDGGSPIAKYTVTSDTGGVTVTTDSTSVTVAGLTQYTKYTFTVTATNAAGTSASSEPSPSVRTKLTNPSAAPSLSGWGLVALAAGMLAVMAVALRLTSGSRPAARP